MATLKGLIGGRGAKNAPPELSQPNTPDVEQRLIRLGERLKEDPFGALPLAKELLSECSTSTAWATSPRVGRVCAGLLHALSRMEQAQMLPNPKDTRELEREVLSSMGYFLRQISDDVSSLPESLEERAFPKQQITQVFEQLGLFVKDIRELLKQMKPENYSDQLKTFLTDDGHRELQDALKEFVRSKIVPSIVEVVRAVESPR